MEKKSPLYVDWSKFQKILFWEQKSHPKVHKKHTFLEYTTVSLNCEVNCKEIAYMKAAGGEKNQHFVFWQSDFLLKSSLFATNFTKSPPFFSLKFSGIFSGFPKISGILKNRILGNSLKFLGKKKGLGGTIRNTFSWLGCCSHWRMLVRSVYIW